MEVFSFGSSGMENSAWKIRGSDWAVFVAWTADRSRVDGRLPPPARFRVPFLFSQVKEVCHVKPARVFAETLPTGNKPLELLTNDEQVRSIHGTSYTRLFNADLLTVVREFATDFEAPPEGVDGGTITGATDTTRAIEGSDLHCGRSCRILLGVREVLHYHQMEDTE